MEKEMVRKSFKLFAGCSLVLFCVSIVYLHSNNTFVSVYCDNNETLFNVDELKNKDIWISMALCWGNRANFNQKNEFPYALAGHFSSKLWHQIFNVTVIFHIVVCDETVIFDDFTLNDYINGLKESKVAVKVIHLKDCTKCVLEAQLIRLLAYNSPEVSFLIKTSAEKCPQINSTLELGFFGRF